MIKRVTKERVVEYAENDIFCDLCEKAVPEGTAMINLQPAIAEADGRKSPGNHIIEVCSVECLTKNAGAAGLLLNMKYFPELRAAHAEQVKKRKKDESMVEEYRKIQQDLGSYKQLVNDHVKPMWTGTYTSTNSGTIMNNKLSAGNTSSF